MVNELIKWGFFIYLGIIPLIPDTINSKYNGHISCFTSFCLSYKYVSEL